MFETLCDGLGNSFTYIESTGTGYDLMCAVAAWRTGVCLCNNMEGGNPRDSEDWNAETVRAWTAAMRLAACGQPAKCSRIAVTPESRNDYNIPPFLIIPLS
eukprot:scpid8371/ scgid20016/ 